MFPYIEFENWSVCDDLSCKRCTLPSDRTVHDPIKRGWAIIESDSAFTCIAGAASPPPQPLYQQALDNPPAGIMVYDPDVATSFNNLAANCRWTGRFQEAVRFYRHSLEVYHHLPRVPYDDFVATVNNLALLYQLMGHTTNLTIIQSGQGALPAGVRRGWSRFRIHRQQSRNAISSDRTL